MSLPLTDQLLALEQLQEIDLKMDSVSGNKKAIPQALKTLDDGLAKVMGQVTIKQAQIAEIQKTHRQTQAALEMNRDRLGRSSGKLESVQNSHAYNAATKEAEQLKKMASTLEDQAKKASADIEIAEKELATLTTKLDGLKGEREVQATAVSGQTGQLEKQLQGLKSERTAFTSRVEPRILAQYERVRPQRGGLGIVPAIGGRCKGCNMMVPPQMFNELQKGSAFHSCPSCHRILFVKNDSPKG